VYIFRYIPAEEIPIQYGGFKRENDTEFFSSEDGYVSELILKAGSTQTIEIDAAEVLIILFLFRLLVLLGFRQND
jgi:hypothetical protein